MMMRLKMESAVDNYDIVSCDSGGSSMMEETDCVCSLNNGVRSEERDDHHLRNEQIASKVIIIPRAACTSCVPFVPLERAGIERAIGTSSDCKRQRVERALVSATASRGGWYDPSGYLGSSSRLMNRVRREQYEQTFNKEFVQQLQQYKIVQQSRGERALATIIADATLTASHFHMSALDDYDDDIDAASLSAAAASSAATAAAFVARAVATAVATAVAAGSAAPAAGGVAFSSSSYGSALNPICLDDDSSSDEFEC